MATDDDNTLFVLVNSLLVLAVLLLLAWVVRRARGAKRRPSWVGNAGWALLFLTSGRMPPPPPETQIEVELNGEKDRNAGSNL